MAEPHDIDRHRIIAQTRAWVDRAVIGLNLCPFARSAQAAGRVRYELSEARDPGALLDDLAEALAALAAADPAEVETTLLVAPWTLGDFLDFNDFLDPRSEEHTSELQSRENLVCRLLLEKKKKH